ncbi:MAG: hypothetical protein Q9216_007075 [Gyalolechia sp. 2 TL-2023]
MPPLNQSRQPLNINQWRQEVIDATRPQKPSKSQNDPPSPRRLRSRGRPLRSNLCAISGNRQKLQPPAETQLIPTEPTLKRKRQMSVPRGPGRPPGRGRGGTGRGTDINRGRGRGGAGNRTENFQHEEQQDDIINVDPVPAGSEKITLKHRGNPQSQSTESSNRQSSRGSTATSRSQSRPRSRKCYTFDQPISVSQVSLIYLASCHPSVRPRRVDQIRRDFPAEVYRPTLTLYAKLMDLPSNLIPPSLKTAYDEQVDTPCKSRDPPPSHQYASSTDQLYPQALLPQIMKKVDEVRKVADWNEQNKADEDQWGLVVHLLLAEVASWPRAQATKVLKSSRCTINPPSIYTRMPGGRPLKYDPELASRATDTSSEQGSDRTIAKMVDWSLGLEIDYKDDDKISEAFGFCDDHEHSLNQSMSFIKRVPLFGDLELKKELQARDPAVQLAIWKSAWLLKAQHHGWDISLPMPGLTVIGHDWSFYLFMAADDGLIMMGPFPIGTTANLNGVWTIICRLNILFEWGSTTYKEWFHRNIMTWAENTKAEALKGLSLGSDGAGF